MKSKKSKTSLNDVHTVLGKWLYLEDFNVIDMVLAVALSNQIKGTPIWLILSGNSGDGKTEILNGLSKLPNVRKEDQLTTNTLISGKKDAKDLGYYLDNKDMILLLPDMACLTSKEKNTKKEIWASFRNLYDGFLSKTTGNDTQKKYNNIHVTIIGASTPIIKKEFLIHQALGTRELLYDTYSSVLTDDMRMDKALMNEEFEAQMKKEISDVMTGFMKCHKVQKITLSNDIIDYLKDKANELKIYRASVDTDKYYHELVQPISIERPTRLIKQLKRIYVSLKSLDNNYSDDKAKEIIEHIVKSSGNETRRHIVEVMLPKIGYTIPEIQDLVKLGRTAVKPQLEALWHMGVLHKDTSLQQVGNRFEYVSEYMLI